MQTYKITREKPNLLDLFCYLRAENLAIMKKTLLLGLAMVAASGMAQRTETLLGEGWSFLRNPMLNDEMTAEIVNVPHA